MGRKSGRILITFEPGQLRIELKETSPGAMIKDNEVLGVCAAIGESFLLRYELIVSTSSTTIMISIALVTIVLNRRVSHWIGLGWTLSYMRRRCNMYFVIGCFGCAFRGRSVASNGAQSPLNDRNNSNYSTTSGWTLSKKLYVRLSHWRDSA